MESLTERFESIQEQLLTIYESESTDLETLINYWDLMRQENLMMYYARQKGLTRIGLQHLPVLQVSETKAKQAIQMKLLLQSLLQSPYGSEAWTLSDVSLELYNAEPEQTFKKQGQTVTVIYDRDKAKEFPYVSWRYIYHQDENGNWHKAAGKVQHAGLSYTDEHGNDIFYQQFQEDADKYSTTGVWEVIFNNKTISAPATSSRPSEPAATGHTAHKTQRTTRSQESPPAKRPRLGRGEGERRERTRTEADSSTDQQPGIPSPEQVGSRTVTVGGGYSTRLGRLQAEAWDPPIIILKGGANAMKCWRNRCKTKCSRLFTYMSTVFQWVHEGHHQGPVGGRMLVAFASEQQRTEFLNTVTIPKGVTWGFGQLDSL